MSLKINLIFNSWLSIQAQCEVLLNNFSKSYPNSALFLSFNIFSKAKTVFSHEPQSKRRLHRTLAPLDAR